MWCRLASGYLQVLPGSFAAGLSPGCGSRLTSQLCSGLSRQPPTYSLKTWWLAYYLINLACWLFWEKSPWKVILSLLAGHRVLLIKPFRWAIFSKMPIALAAVALHRATMGSSLCWGGMAAPTSTMSGRCPRGWLIYLPLHTSNSLRARSRPPAASSMAKSRLLA